MIEKDYKRFMSKVTKTNDCWLWSAGKDQKDYGMFSITINGNTKTCRAHRAMYEHVNGLIPEGMMICHSCDIPGCVNPSHLWLGTMSDNALDSVYKNRHGMAKKTHCPYGHEYTFENTYINPNKRHKGRECRMCMRRRNREWWKCHPPRTRKKQRV